MLLLFLRYLVPLAGLGYLIKKNPFYKSYPAALPFMMFLFVFVGYRMSKYAGITN